MLFKLVIHIIIITKKYKNYKKYEYKANYV